MNLGSVDTRRYFAVVAVILVVLFAWLGPEGTVRARLHRHGKIAAIRKP